MTERGLELQGHGRWRQAFASAAFYAFAGPPIAGVIAVLALAVASALEGDTEQAALLGVLGLPLAVFFSYIFGVLPALLTGLLAGWFSHRIQRWRHVLYVALLGLIVTSACWAAFTWRVDSGDFLPRTSNTLQEIAGPLLFGLPGLVAAFFCGWRQMRTNRIGSASSSPEPDSTRQLEE